MTDDPGDFYPPELERRRRRYEAILSPSSQPDEVYPGLFLGPTAARYQVEALGITEVFSFLPDASRAQASYRRDLPVTEHRYVLDDTRECPDLTLTFLRDPLDEERKRSGISVQLG